MNRSCGSTSASASSRTTAAAAVPGAISRPSSGATRARYCAVPWWSRTWSPDRSGRAPGSTETQASKRRPDAPASSGATSQSPRPMSSRSRPRRFTPDAAAGVHHLGLVVVHLHAAHGGARAAGLDGHGVPGADLARPERAGHDRADALEREDPVHGQAGRAGAAARLGPPGRALERGQQLVQAAPVPGAHGDHLAAGERRRRQELAHVRLGQLEQLLVHQVGLGERHDAVAHPEQLDDREVLHRLRHHAVVGGDDEEEEVDAGGSRDHGAHEALVAGHVDDAQPRAGRQLELRVARARWRCRARAPRAGGRCSCR